MRIETMLVPGLLIVGAWTGAARAGGTLSVDAPTLNMVLPAVMPGEVMVELPTGSKLAVELDDFTVTGFDPAAADGSNGHVLTSVRVRIPTLGLDVPLTPRLSVRVLQEKSEPLVELRMANAEIRLPLMGKIDLASMMPPQRFPASNLFRIEGTEGPVALLGRVTGLSMGAKVLRVDFEIEKGASP